MKNYYVKWRGIALSCFLMFSALSSLNAQVSAYLFQYSVGSYTPITGGSVLGTATNDDTSFPNLPIGFSFVYNGNTYTQFSCQSNGFIAMGTTITSSYTPLSTGSTNNVIAAYGDDLQGNTTTGNLRYETIGTAPNRILVVQWTSYRKFAATGDNYNFQIRLHETTNIVEVVYGGVTNNATTNTGHVGLRGASNADFNNRTTATDWTATTAGGANNATCTISSTVFPASGTTFRWLSCPTVAPTVMGSSICTGNTADITATSTLGGTINWYDAATGGNLVGTGSPFTTPVLSATTSFFAAESFGACPETPTAEAIVNVDAVVVTLDPVNILCNGDLTGSFTQSSVQCGTGPFTYSIDGGAFGPIPTNMAAGTYSIVVMDATMATTSPISLTITEPSSPYNITFVNVGYYSAGVTWMSDGTETSWDVEIGPAGFTPGTGTTQTVSTMSASFTGLTEATSYDVYITPACSGNETPGTAVLTTNQGFFTYDNACGPGFIDISATGTSTFVVDEAEFGVTMPFTFNYQGLNVTDITIADNGGVILNTLTASLGFGNTAITGTTANGLYPFWDDLDDGDIYYETVGTAPNRMFIVQWENRPHFVGVAGQDITFQLIIEEATGEVYFLYEDVVFGGTQTSSDYGASATIGVAGPTTDVQVSFNNATYLQNNSCAHFYYALCPNPVNPIVTTFQEEVIIDWSAGLYGETDWTVIYGPAGFDPATSGTTLTTSSPSINILGLTQITQYDVYIYSECMLDNLTSPGLLVEFQTLPWCNTPTGGTNATAVDSLFANWNWTEVTGAPNALTGFNILYGNSGFDLYSGTPVIADAVDNSDTIVNAAFLAGGVYQYYVQAECGTDTSNYAGPFTFVMPLSNDSVCGAEMLMADGTVYLFNNAGATVGTGESAIAPGATGFQNETGWGNSTLNNSTWYMFEAPASGNVRINHNVGNAYAGQSAVYEVTDCGDYATFTLIAANDNSMVNNAAAPNYTICGLTPGATYYLLHDGNSATTGNHVISIIPINLNAGAYTSTIDVCTGGDVNLFDGITGNDAGGVWTAMNAAAATQLTDSIWNSAGLAYNIPFEFEYRLTDGCAYDSVIALVEIFPLSSAGPDGSITVCRNEPVDLLSGLSGNVDLGGTWYDPSNQPLSNSEIVASNFPGQFNYDYVTGNGVCPDDTALVLVNVLSTCDYLNIQEMFFADMTVYPNPSNAVFNVANYGSTEVFSYEVTDIDGRVITSKEAAINGTTTTEIDLKDKVTGVYFIKVYNENAEKTFRVVLQ
ncbi:MAG: T9SS type A sorting domain-containing protein [Bacteroidetes bacterium]|nr:MAG: T9SS type A sorting domain-containing protein [Bacteroidota bacterium]